MSAHLSREDYVSACRQESVAICLGILSGTTGVLEGCHTLASLRFEVQVSEGDEDFNVFGAISSETDALPVGAVRTHWAPEALARIQPEIDAAVSWALPLAIPACTSVVQRFGPNYSLKRTDQSLRA